MRRILLVVEMMGFESFYLVDIPEDTFEVITSEADLCGNLSGDTTKLLLPFISAENRITEDAADQLGPDEAVLFSVDVEVQS